jgi:hypothetical protein
MKCPECGETNDEGVSICQHCDAIMDASFLGDDFTSDDMGEDAYAEDTPAEEEDPDPAPAPSRGRAKRRSFASSSGYNDDSYDEEDQDQDEDELEGDEDGDEIERQLAALRAKRDRAPDPPHSLLEQQEAAKADEGSLGDEVSRVQKDMESSLGKVGVFLKSLEKADKLALGGAAGMFIFPLFPWANISSQGSVSGLEIGGWFLMLLAACVGTLTYLRKDEHWQSREQYIVYVQTGVGVVSVLFLLVKLFSLGSIMPSYPEGMGPTAGLYSVGVGSGLLLALAACGLMGFGTFLLLQAKVLKK